MIEEDLDRELEVMSRAERCSKAALIRRCIREKVQHPVPLEEDPITLWAGEIDSEGSEDDSLIVDDVVYPR
jgi:hypothetical protein